MNVAQRQRIAKYLFAAYLIALFWLLIGWRIGYHTSGNTNFVPLETVRLFLWVLKNSGDRQMRWQAVANLVGNVVLFVPLGLFLPMLWKKCQNLVGFFLWLLPALIMVELLQLVTRLGACDVDDLLLNTLGALGGWLLWKLLHLRSNSSIRE